MVGFVGVFPEAKEARWYREGSMAVLFGFSEAEPFGIPVPSPVTFGDRRVDDLDNGLASKFLSRWLAFWLETEAHSSALDNNLLAAFRRVQEQS